MTADPTTPQQDNWLMTRRYGWEPLVALLVMDVLFAMLSGPVNISRVIATAMGIPAPWLLLAVTLVLGLPLLMAWLGGHQVLARNLTLIYVSVDTIKLMFSIVALVVSLDDFSNTHGGFQLLQDVLITWVANVLVFSAWYWMLDAGGVHRRHGHHPPRGDFLFPQHSTQIAGWEGWRPNYVDYLFLAFTTSTAFGPTDVLMLSRRAKVLVMMQAGTSFASFGVLAARAISIIT